MEHFIYKTTNTINGKYYIGAHSVIKGGKDDNYIGSGIALKAAIKKYGKNVFIREIVCYCSTLEEMYEKEEEIIEQHLGNTLCYNMKPGGKGGWYNVNITDMHVGDNNVMRKCPEIRKQVTESAKKTKLLNREYYANISRQNGRKSRGQYDRAKCHSEGWKNNWKNNYEKMRNALSSFFEVTSPTGEVDVTNRLEEYCTEHDITYVALWNTSRTHKIVKKGKAKGWICKKISQP